MMRICIASLASLCVLLLLAANASAEVTVKTEHLNPVDPAWKFKTIPGPSNSDAAQNAVVTIHGNELEPNSGDPTVLVNGCVPDDPNNLVERALLSNAHTEDGTIVIDMLRTVPIAAVTSYSCDVTPPEQPCRAPQSYTLDNPQRKARAYFNLYNNQWHTNFPEWTEGTWTSRVHLWLGDGLTVPSWEARAPLVTATADGPAGKLPESQSGLSVSRPGVLATAFGDNPDGKGTLLRVWEQTGESGNVTVTIPGQFQTATPINLRGEALGPDQPIQENRVMLDLSAYAPASFVLD